MVIDLAPTSSGLYVGTMFKTKSEVWNLRLTRYLLHLLFYFRDTYLCETFWPNSWTVLNLIVSCMLDSRIIWRCMLTHNFYRQHSGSDDHIDEPREITRWADILLYCFNSIWKAHRFILPMIRVLQSLRLLGNTLLYKKYNSSQDYLDTSKYY